MKAWILPVLLVTFLNATAQPSDQLQPGSLEIQFDLDNAKQTIALLRKKQVSKQELDAWVKLAGTKAAISKVRSSADTAISAMRKVILQQVLTAEEKRFQFDQIQRNLDIQELFIQNLEKRKDSITMALQSSLLQYLPAGTKAVITLYGLMGTYSAGFAFTRDPSAFYMGLHFYRNDITGVVVSAKHELFHTIQSMAYNFEPVMDRLKQIDSAYEAPYYLIRHLFLEGSAEYMADGKPYIANSVYLKNEYEHAAVNAYRHQAVFYLLEHLLLDIYTDPGNMDFEQVYSILFDWNWNNPAYYAGKEMMSALVKEKGEGYVNKSIGRDALYFVSDYIQLAKEKPSLGLYTFSPAFEKMLTGMINNLGQ